MKLKINCSAVYIASKPIDFRCGINTLSALITDHFTFDPYDKSLYIFTNNRRDRIKCLLYDGTGFWLLYKVLNEGRFSWTVNREGMVSITSEQLEWLLSGLSVDSGTVFREYHPQYA